MPVEFVETKGFKVLRFTRNTAHDGTDYGPDYPQDTCQVRNAAAFHYLSQGRAVEVKRPRSNEVQTQDPSAQNRDPGAPGELRQDGPTLQEWIAAGYKAEHYPPQGYAPRESGVKPEGTKRR